jgi:hypothetical protein
MPRMPRKTLTERVADLELRNQESEQKLQRLHGQLVKMRLEQSTRIPEVASPQDPRAAIAAWLDSLATGLTAIQVDPELLTHLLARIQGMPPQARPFFAGIALDTSRTLGLRLAAVMAMGHSKDSTMVAPLKLVCADTDAHLRREALTALGRIGHPSALEIAKRLMADSDPGVSLTAEEVVNTLAPPKESKPRVKAQTPE